MPLFNGWKLDKSNPDTERFHLNKILSAIQTAVNSAALTTWGSITGTLADQTDLQAALDAKEAAGTAAAAVAAHEAAGEHTQLDLPEIAEPAAPSADTVRLYATDSNGISELEMKDSTGLVHRIGEELLTRVRNTTGATLAVGAAVYVTGSTGSTPTVALARSDADATTPCVGLVVEAIPNNGFGRIISKGTISNVDTSAFVEGNPVYLSATVAGGLTSTAPTHPNLLQKVGTVTNVGVGNGKILVNVDAVIRPLTQSITNGDTTHAPSSDTVFDALAGYQPVDATLTALAGLDTTLGLLEQTAADTFTKRAIGVAAATDVLTRADGDGRYSTPSDLANYLPLTGGTLTGDIQVLKSGAVVGVGLSGSYNGGITNYGAAGDGQVGLFSEYAGGILYLRPNGRSDITGQVLIQPTLVSLVARERITMNVPALSGTAYINGHIELRTDDSSLPRIGFHRAGVDAIALYFNGVGDMRLRRSNNSDAALYTDFNFAPGGLTPSTTNQYSGTTHTHAITGFASLTAANSFSLSQKVNVGSGIGDWELQVAGVQAGGIFADTSTPRACFYGSTGSTLHFRPNGRASVTGESTLTSAGVFTAPSVNDSKGNVRDIPRITRNSTTAIQSTDGGKAIVKDNTTAYTWNVNTGVFTTGMAVTVINDGTAGNVTIAQGADMTVVNGSTTGDYTLQPGESRTLYGLSATRVRVL